MKSPPKRGRGERRVPAAPAASCALVVVESTRVTTSTPESPDVPARNGFTAYFALSPVTGLFATVAREYGLPAPGRADRTSANLTPASGRQDHTTSPYAATSLVRVLLTAHGFPRTRPAIPSRARRCRVHRTPSRVRDDRDTPLCVGRDGETHRDVSTNHGSEIFLQRGLDMPVNKPPDGQITGPRREHIPRVADAVQRHQRVRARLDAPRLRRGALLIRGP
jgi:hypothetical protein